MLMPIHLLFAVFDVIYQGLNWHSLFCTKLLSLVLSIYLFCVREILIRSAGSGSGPYGHFSTEQGSAILNVDPSPTSSYVTAQCVAERRRTRNITLASLWIKCLRCGNVLNWTAKVVQRRHVTSAVQPFREGVTKKVAFNTTHLIQ